MSVAHNIPALTAFTSLNRTNQSLQKYIQALSTGLRINSASDDAAGFAISEKMRSQIRGLDVALRNSQDGMSMLQTAEGALEQTTSMLQRMRELAIQASNDTLTSQDRQYIQLEVDQLKSQIDRIAGTTQFNKKRILDGSVGALWSSSDEGVRARINGGLTYTDNFGQKVSVEGNYRIEVKCEPGRAQVQKTNIMRVASIHSPTEGIEENNYHHISINNGQDDAGLTSGKGWNFDAIEGVLTITGKGTYDIYGGGAETTNRIVVATGIVETATVFLKDVNINVSYTDNACAFDMAGSVVDLYLDGYNTLRSGQSKAGLEVPDGAELRLSSVKGDGETEGILNVKGGTHAAGIGGMGTLISRPEYRMGRAGKITIYGGTVIARGGAFAAGIGGGTCTSPYPGALRYMNGGGNIVIHGGNIHASSDGGGVGIGTAYGAEGTGSAVCGDDGTEITITGGTIEALGNSNVLDGTTRGYVYSAGIGGGGWSKGGKIRIGPEAVISASAPRPAEDIGRGGYDDGTPSDVRYVDIHPPVSRELPKRYAYRNVPENVTSSTLSEIHAFRNASGKFLISQPQTLTITQGDGQTASITLYETDTIYDMASKINAVIADTFGNAKYTDNPNKFCTISDGTEGTSESIYSREAVYDDDGNITGYNVNATMLIRSGIPGHDGELSFSGDEELINALGLNTIQESSESRFTASVYDTHSGKPVVSGAKVTGNVLTGAIHNVDIEFSAMAGVKALWNENTKSYMLTGGTKYTATLHLEDSGITFQTGANGGEDFFVQLGDMSARALGISSVNLATRESASRAIGTIDHAISKVSSQRAKIGAYANALEHTMTNLTTTSTNLTASESRIRDADMAGTMMEFVKLQILNRSGTSMLAQANQLLQSGLSSVKN